MSNKTTLMNEAVDTENTTMQQVSGTETMETENVSVDDLLYLINTTNESNETLFFRGKVGKSDEQ